MVLRTYSRMAWRIEYCNLKWQGEGSHLFTSFGVAMRLERRSGIFEVGYGDQLLLTTSFIGDFQFLAFKGLSIYEYLGRVGLLAYYPG